MKLYELREEYNALLAQIESGEGDIPEDALKDTLEAIDGEIREKAISIATLIKSLDADIALFRAEEDKLAARRKQMEKRVEWLKSYVTTELGKANIDNIRNDPRAVISFRRSRVCEISDEAKFIDWAQEHRPMWITTKYLPNRAAAKEAIETGAECPYAKNVDKTNIQIK